MIKIKKNQKNNHLAFYKNCVFFSYHHFFYKLFRVFICYFFIVFANCFNFVFANDLGYTSAIAIDANNGEVLYSYNADIKIYPASLTKMMTAYLVFQAINDGVVGLNDAVNDSQTIKDLLLKMAVNSDNNSAIKLANEVSGDYYDFVMEMNKMAKKIKMNNTHFANATGLFDENNYSTARDMAKLTIRLVYDFPQYIDIFGTTNYIDENSEYNTKTTTIQQNIKGLKGGKTGYLSASGYNLSVWGDYYGKNIFIVMIGADTRYSRDENVLKILNKVVKKNKLPNKNNNVKDEKDVLTNKIFNFIGLDYNSYLTKQPVERLKSNNISNLNDKNYKKTFYFYKNNK